MKNHFIFGYTGNKREEVEQIYKALKLDGITTIIEPFCGSSSISYYISTKHPGKFKYILNDNNKYLIELYNIIRDDEKFKKFNVRVELFINKYNRLNNEDKKEFYKSITKADNVLSYFIANKYYKFRPFIPPIDKELKINYLNCDIIKFLKNENVEIIYGDGVDLIRQNKKECIYICDPPYMMTSNSFYIDGATKGDFNIYEFAFNLQKEIKRNNIYMIVELNWIMNLLSEKFKVLLKYEKKYNSFKKKTCTHCIILI